MALPVWPVSEVMLCPVRVPGLPARPVRSGCALAYTFFQFPRPKREMEALSPGLQASLSQPVLSLQHALTSPAPPEPLQPVPVLHLFVCLFLVPLHSDCPRGNVSVHFLPRCPLFVPQGSRPG